MATQNNPKDNAPKKADVLNASEAIKTDASSIPTPKSESEKNLFQIGDELTNKINAQKVTHLGLSNKKIELVARRDEIINLLKPIAKFRRSSRVLPELPKLSSVDRKGLRNERERIKAELVKIDDLLLQAADEYTRLTGRSFKDAKKNQLVNKANSKKYTGQNLHLFKRKLLQPLPLSSGTIKNQMYWQ